MRQKGTFDMRTPIFFKIWFGFVALLALSIMGGMVYALVLVVQAGPKGIGQQIGAVVKGYNEAK